MPETNKNYDLLDIQKRIEAVLNSNRHYLQEDGGDVEFIELFFSDYMDKEVLKAKIRFLGECKICPLSPMTLRAGIEKAIKEVAPEIFRIEEEN